MDDWQRKALRSALVGGLSGAAGSLVLNAIYHMRNRRKPVNELVPNSVIERPYFVDPDQAAELEARGIPVKPGYGLSKTAREYMHANDSSFIKIAEKAGIKTAEGNPLVKGFQNVALPILTGLGAGYAGFRGVDYLMDSMARDDAKSRYDKKRKELEELMANMHGGGLQKVAEDYVEGGNLYRTAPKLAAAASEALRKVAFLGFDKLVDKGINTAKGATQGPLESLSGWGVALPFALASLIAFPKAVKSFREANPNRSQVLDIEDYYRKLPEHRRIKLVPTLRRPQPQKPAEEDDELQKVANAASAGGVTASTVTPDLTPKIDTPKAPPAMPAGSGKFNGRFSLSQNSGFTRKGVGNMPMPKDPAARTPRNMGSIGTALG